MSRQNRNPERDRKNEEMKRDVADVNERYQESSRESRENREQKDSINISGLDRYRLNDLYERSSI
jgi:hypothetical protein